MTADQKFTESLRRADFVRNFDKIINGATVALASNSGASMREIAEHSGLGRATLYRHFSTRDELLRAIFSSGLRSASDAIEAAEPQRGNSPEALRRVIDRLMIVVNRYRIITEQRLEYPDLLPESEAVFSPLTELFERGQAEGSIRSDLPPRWLTTAIAMACVAALGAVGRGDFDLADASEVVARTILERVEVPLATGS